MKLQIRTNSRKGTGMKIAKKMEQFWKILKEKSQFLALFLTQRPSDDWPDALNHRFGS